MLIKQSHMQGGRCIFVLGGCNYLGLSDAQVIMRAIFASLHISSAALLYLYVHSLACNIPCSPGRETCKRSNCALQHASGEAHNDFKLGCDHTFLLIQPGTLSAGRAGQCRLLSTQLSLSQARGGVVMIAWAFIIEQDCARKSCQVRVLCP